MPVAPGAQSTSTRYSRHHAPQCTNHPCHGDPSSTAALPACHMRRRQPIARRAVASLLSQSTAAVISGWPYHAASVVPTGMVSPASTASSSARCSSRLRQSSLPKAPVPGLGRSFIMGDQAKFKATAQGGSGWSLEGLHHAPCHAGLLLKAGRADSCPLLLLQHAEASPHGQTCDMRSSRLVMTLVTLPSPAYTSISLRAC